MNNQQFARRQPNFIGEEHIRKYAVLVPIIKTEKRLCILFERRANHLRIGPLEISFPGGKLEKNETIQACAIRETMEELNIHQNQVEIIGPGDVFFSPFSLIIYPYLGVINDYKDTFSEDEVENIIKIPLKFFMNHSPDHFRSELINHPPKDFPYEWIPYGRDYPWSKGSYDLYFYHYQETIIWGITAHIVKSMVSLIQDYQLFKTDLIRN
ncbi:NUDIX hydrolase [Haloplasma contractile]|uniref:A-G-specific adenine glycosylase protein n=1 Tax=Haloplasma contractile SSD-17B TaxID=1033810 RepID=U2FDG8_9MOLU|nr:CoA pyrophosphatase [Haloplasma contractile]ERJ11015.1 A-G-specific adenine glycosylase protein [Haloplasma contractile SSD-17B]